MNPVMNTWKHIFKLDPTKEISDESLARLCESGTDALIVGGTDHITYDNVVQLLWRIKEYNNQLPCILEISSVDAIAIGFDYYFIPMVMNSKDKKWMMDIQHQAIKQYRNFMDWDSIFMEGYCILNEQSKAYIKTNCQLPDEQDILTYAYMAERIFQLPIFYLEYSGVYGDPEMVEAVKDELDHTLLFYGGGITNSTQAIEMKEHADVIIVGNSIYTHFTEAIQTVEAVQNMK